MNINLLVRLIGSASLISTVISVVASGATVSTGGQRIAIDPKVASLVKQASSALKGKQHDLAISCLTAALQMKPEKNTASAIYTWRADAFIQKGELNKAMDDANESIRLNPHFSGGYLERGIVYRRTGNLDKSISDYDTVIRLNPNSALAYYDRAIAYGYKGEYERSIRDSTEAIRRNPKDAGDYELIGNFDKAIADYTEAVRLNPTDPAAYSGRGYVNVQAGNLNRASADYDQATRCIPKDASGYVFRGKAYFAKGNHKAAASDFAKATQLSSNDDQVLNSLSWFKATCPEASFRNGKEAVQEAIKACELTNWKNPHGLDTLAAAYAEIGDFDQAEKYQTEALGRKGVYPFRRKKMQERLELYRQRKPYRDESKLTR